MNETKNAYEDEKEKIDNDFEVELELTLKIEQLLEQYGYFVNIKMKEGVPVLELVKLS